MENKQRECRFVSRCPMFPRFKNTKGLEIFQSTYCRSANHVRCERFKLASAGTMPPAELLPNGRILPD